MAFNVKPVEKQLKRRFYCFTRATCSECGNPHNYPKIGTPAQRFDGRRYKYICYERRTKVGMKQELGEPEAGLQLDIFGLTTEVRPKGKGKIIKPTLDDALRDQAQLHNWKQATQKGGTR